LRLTAWTLTRPGDTGGPGRAAQRTIALSIQTIHRPVAVVVYPIIAGHFPTGLIETKTRRPVTDTTVAVTYQAIAVGIVAVDVSIAIVVLPVSAKAL